MGNTNRLPASVISATQGMSKYFKRNPGRLEEYVRNGHIHQLGVLDVHIFELAASKGVTLRINGVPRNPIGTFVRPDVFENVGFLI